MTSTDVSLQAVTGNVEFAPSLKMWAAAATPSRAAARTRRSARIAAQVTDTKGTPKLSGSTTAASAPSISLRRPHQSREARSLCEVWSRPLIPIASSAAFSTRDKTRRRTDCHVRATQACHAMFHVSHDRVFYHFQPLSSCRELACLLLGIFGIAKPGFGVPSLPI